MNEQISVFDLTTLPFERYLLQQHVFQFRKPKSSQIFETPLFEKRMDHPP
jgi:hypothetical protein